MELKKQPFDGPGLPPEWMPPTADISWVKRKFLDVLYGTESPRQCSICTCRRRATAPFPLFIHIHGGGFAFGDKRDDHMDAYLDGGLPRGHTVKHGPGVRLCQGPYLNEKTVCRTRPLDVPHVGTCVLPGTARRRVGSPCPTVGFSQQSTRIKCTTGNEQRT